MHRKHGIDRGTEVTEGSGASGGYPSGSGVPPPPEKLQHTSNTIVLPLIFGIWFGVFAISTARRPIQLQSAIRRPDCAWTVGIASVGIVWCTHSIWCTRSLWSRSVMLGSAESQVSMLIIREITFAVLHNLHTCDHSPPTLQTDGQLIMAILRYATLRAAKTYTVQRHCDVDIPQAACQPVELVA